MQRSLYPITPQKRNLSKLSFHDQHLLKELSPLVMTVGSSGYGKVKLQMLHSPLPSNKDLFSQLLASQFKANYDDYFQNYEILEEDSYQIMDELNMKDYNSEHDSDMLDDNDDEEDENGIKKRKRKSTVQIKMLKNQLEVEPNWSKEKIAEMSQITGLSQSQVYKWWWDQKKKNIKNQKENQSKMAAKRKHIKKDYSKRPSLCYGDSNEQSNEEEEEEPTFTKLKNVIEIEEVPETEKKVSKRLTFI